jgi:hypothetical protein
MFLLWDFVGRIRAFFDLIDSDLRSKFLFSNDFLQKPASPFCHRALGSD